jgi:YfiH family protein
MKQMPTSPRTSRPSPPPAKADQAAGAIPPNPDPNPDPDQIQSQLDRIDTLFQTVGLVRHRRHKPAGVARRAALQDKTPEDLRPATAEPTVAPNGVEWVAVPGWNKLPWLWHGFSTRRGGVTKAYAPEDAPGELNLGFTPDDDRENVLLNRQLLAEAVSGSPATPIVMLRQIHSGLLVIPTPETAARPSPTACKGDGLITQQPGILIGVQTADCVPVLVADRKRKVVAAFHAGWRGTVKRIVENGIGRMRLEFGSRPQDLIAAIGPAIGPCCYSVGEEVLSEFESQFPYERQLFHEVYDTNPVRTRYPMLFLTQRAPGHSPMGPSLHLDLVEANRRQLLAAGLKPNAIQSAGGCTACQPQTFFSHRASCGRAGRMLSVIGIRPDPVSRKQKPRR